MANEYNAFVTALEEMGVELDTNGMTLAEKSLMRKIWANVINFIDDNQLAAGTVNTTALEDLRAPISQFNDRMTLSDIGAPAIVGLCESCKVAPQMMHAAVRSIAFAIANKNAMDYGTHFNAATPAVEDFENVNVRALSTVLGPSAMANIEETGRVAGVEAFGKDIDKVVTDMKMNLAINILKFHKNLVDRLINRKPVAGNMVQFQVPYAEAYDLAKASAADSATRNHSDHKVPFLDLYKNPETANTAAKLIEPLKVNDADGVLLADSQLMFDADIPMFDLAMDAAKVGYNHVDYSDLVSEGVMLDTIYLSVTDGTTTEILPIVVKGRSSARYLMRASSRDSAERSCVLNEAIKLDSTTEVTAGTPTTLLSTVTGGAFVRARIRVSGEINLKTADTSAHGTLSTEITTDDGSAVDPAIVTDYNALTFSLAAYSLDARYSEENMRKTSAAVRMNMRPLSYEIPVGKNVVVDYSLAQVQPDAVLNVVSQAIAIGNDYRAINFMMEQLNIVYDRIQSEGGDGIFLDHQDRIGYDYVAGMQVMPAVFMDTFDIDAAVTSLSSGRTLGDIRGAVEKYLIEMCAKLYSDSMYVEQLNPGEKPRFRVLTSGPVLASILNVPHYHDHLNTTAPADGENILYTRVLPDGTVLEVFTTTWEMMTDKMLLVPFRATAPDSILNFAQNCDRGTFVANFSPTSFQATHKRIATNSREIPIITNPVAALLTITKISELFDGMASLGV